MLLVGTWHWQPQTAILVAIVMATAVFHVGAIFFIYLQSDTSEDPALRWPVVTISILTYLLILKVIFMGSVNLIPEEAYYWNYAQHLDWGYLRPSTDGCLADLALKTPQYLANPNFLVYCLCLLDRPAIFMFHLTLNSTTGLPPSGLPYCWRCYQFTLGWAFS